MTSHGQSPGKAFRSLLEAPPAVVAPGVYDALSAQLAEAAGFSAIYLGGFSTAAQLGTVEPLLTLTEQAAAARAVAQAVDVPVIVDGHSGYGDPVHVTRTIRELERAGVAAIHLEDAVYPKRAHYFQDVVHLVDVKEMVAKLRYAQEERDDPDLVIMARTEARVAQDGGLDEVLRRLEAYAEAGADVLLPQLWDPDELRRVGEAFKGVPLLFFAVTRRPLPELSVAEAEALGYKVVVYPVSAIGEAAAAVTGFLTSLRTTGRTGREPAELRDTWNLVDEVTDIARHYAIESETTELPARAEPTRPISQ